ncbi:putative F-box protein At4g11580 isoform X2 [Brassica napus]|uniref:putative F-box protein At4g11580 isoform X2 n=1 Tax=Brassica napus TaxID=3708 RepID=UPI002078E335|nr:putative F-box protein At4g11580 isoform X2 [Brassica napus]
MKRLDDPRRAHRWKLSMKSLLCSICNVTVVRSRKNLKWENMDRDILVKIFEKLNVIDVTMGASRVCISWFLASHEKSLWKTINLTNLQRVDFSHPRLPNSRVEDEKVNEHVYRCNTVLFESTKFSSTVPINLFFNYDTYLTDEDLIDAAQRMPNIRKLVLPRWCHLSENSYQFAFRQWKNLQTLIIDQRHTSLTWRHKIQASGENCINLTNFKTLGCLNEVVVEEIVRCFPNLKKLSLRFCDIIDIGRVLPLITSLKNLTTLNLSHCRFLQRGACIIGSRELDNILCEIARYKCETLIMLCSYVDCKSCKDARKDSYVIVRLHAFFEKNWRNDEIEEFEF